MKIFKLFLTGFILCWATMLQAANFIVTTTNDAGAGSLRDAIIQANNNNQPDNITFNIGGGSGAVQTIMLHV